MSKSMEVKIKGFQPSVNGFKFPNRFPGIPLPEALAELIDTSNSVHGLCGGMCFTVIDHFKAAKTLPEVNDVPERETILYDHLAKRQMDSWGTMSTQVLRYVQWMSYSDERAQTESMESWVELKHLIDVEEELTVIGLVYTDFRESVRVWDNHQVLAYGYTIQEGGVIHIHVYDPNYPNNDSIYIKAEPLTVTKKGGLFGWLRGGKIEAGLRVAQYRGEKKIHDMHGFITVPYDFFDPPNWRDQKSGAGMG